MTDLDAITIWALAFIAQWELAMWAFFSDDE